MAKDLIATSPGKNTPFPGDELLRRVTVNVVAVRALESTSVDAALKSLGALAGDLLAPLYGEPLQAGFAFHKPGEHRENLSNIVNTALAD